MFDIVSLIETAGYLGLFLIIFAESGLLIGFFLPGDSLLFTAGVLASQGFLDIKLLALVTFIGAVIGDNVGYATGKKFGPMVFNRDDSILFHREHVVRTEKFFEKHGKKAIILARFLPIVRTFTPIFAGVGRMKYGVFFTFNIIGAVLWAIGLNMIGYFSGKFIPGVDKFLLPIVLIIIFLSILPTLNHLIKDKKIRDNIVVYWKNKMKR